METRGRVAEAGARWSSYAMYPDTGATGYAAVTPPPGLDAYTGLNRAWTECDVEGLVFQLEAEDIDEREPRCDGLRLVDAGGGRTLSVATSGWAPSPTTRSMGVQTDASAPFDHGLEVVIGWDDTISSIMDHGCAAVLEELRVRKEELRNEWHDLFDQRPSHNGSVGGPSPVDLVIDVGFPDLSVDIASLRGIRDALGAFTVPELEWSAPGIAHLDKLFADVCSKPIPGLGSVSPTGGLDPRDWNLMDEVGYEEFASELGALRNELRDELRRFSTGLTAYGKLVEGRDGAHLATAKRVAREMGLGDSRCFESVGGTAPDCDESVASVGAGFDAETAAYKLADDIALMSSERQREAVTILARSDMESKGFRVSADLVERYVGATAVRNAVRSALFGTTSKAISAFDSLSRTRDDAALLGDVRGTLLQSPQCLNDLASRGFAKRFNDIHHNGQRANNGSWTAWLLAIPGVQVERRFGRFHPDSAVSAIRP